MAASQVTTLQTNTSTPLVDLFGDGKEIGINLGPSLTLAKGTLVGQQTSSANDKQTLTLGGSATGGTFTVSGTNPFAPNQPFTTAGLAYNISTADFQTALLAAFGAGNLAVTGTAGTSYVVTFGGNLAKLPIAVMTVDITGLTGGTPTGSWAHTVVGRTAGTWSTQSGAGLAAPTAAPTVVVGAGTTDPPIASAVPTVWTYTYYNSQGETTASPASSLTPDGTHTPSISSIAIPTGATGIRYYANGNLFKDITTAGAVLATQTLLTASYSAAKVPVSNTSYGPILILKYACATDSTGNITYGAASGGGEWGQTSVYTPAYRSGVFRTEELVGLTAANLPLLGRLISGTITSGIISVY